MATRPTSDRLRETLFNVLAPRIERSVFLDLYAGSGAVGLEALSRGASHVTFVERAPAALKVMRTNLERLGMAKGFKVVQAGVASYLCKPRAGSQFDLVFLDPPYDAAREYELALSLLGGTEQSLLAHDALVIAEHRRKEKLADNYGILTRTRLLEQGDAALSFYAVSNTVQEGMDGTR